MVSEPGWRDGRCLVLAGVTIAVAQAGMIALAPALAEEATALPQPILSFVGLGVLGGTAWFLAIGPLERLPLGRITVGTVLVFGAAMRLAWLGTPVVLDTDALRYLWDGALAAHEIWPWGAPPAAGVPPALGPEGAALLPQLRFATLRTIYPATAQAAFLLAHAIAPWELLGLRLVMLGAETMTVLLMVVLLRRARLAVTRAAVWWCCPLLPLVLTNAAHVDALLPPLLLGALLATLAGRGIAAGGLLGLAVGVKVWPLLLVPLFGRWLPPGARLASLLAFLLVAGLCLAPLLATLAAADAGLSAYARGWVVNNAPLAWIRTAFGAEAAQALRPLLGLAAGMVALAVALLPAGDTAALVRAALVVAAATFYLSPAQYPWYAVWFLPFAMLLRCRALLLPAVLLPFYYLVFALRGPGPASFFANGVAALHMLPVLAWLLLGRGMRR